MMPRTLAPESADSRLRSMGLINTEQPQGLTWRFKAFLMARHIPGIAPAVGWIFGQPRLRRNGLVLGKAFADSSLLDGEFDEFFLQPIHKIRARRDAAVRMLHGFDVERIHQLADVHRRITVPVQLVCSRSSGPRKWSPRSPTRNSK